MGEAQGLHPVNAVEHLAALVRQLPVLHGDGLAAAAHTAAGAGHDLHKVVVGPAGQQVLDQGTGLAQAADGGAVQGHTGDGVGGFPPALAGAHGTEGVRVRLFAGKGVGRGAQGGLHHAAGGAKDDARAGEHAHGAVQPFLL